MWKPLEIVTLFCFSVGLAPDSTGAAPIVNEPVGMWVSLRPMPVVTRLGGGNGRDPGYRFYSNPRLHTQYEAFQPRTLYEPAKRPATQRILIKSSR